MRLRLLSLLLMFGLLASCQKSKLSEPEHPQTGAFVNTQISFALPDDMTQNTKASSIDGCEDILYCYDLAIYEHNGRLIRTNHYSREQIASFVNGTEVVIPLSLPPQALDFYLVANMVYINKTTNAPTDVFTAFGASFPTTAEGLDNLFYHIGDYDAPMLSGYRCLYFSEFKTYGIPMRAQRLNYTPTQGGNISFMLERLFAKVDLTVDLASLTGSGKAAARIENAKALVRHANYELRPFSNRPVNNITHATHCAGYYDDASQDMDLAECTEETMNFSLYLPANELEWTMPAGTNLNDIVSNRLTQLYSGTTTDGRTYGAFAASFIEFTATLVDSDNSIGYSGPLHYYFYIVEKNASNRWVVNVKRNKNYRITLRFNPNSIFTPLWKADASDLSDNRLIGLMKYSDRPEALENNGFVVVRSERPAEFYAYLNKSHSFVKTMASELGGSNDLNSLVPFNKKDIVETSDTYSIENLEDLKYYYDVSPYSDFRSTHLYSSTYLADNYGIEIVHRPIDHRILIRKLASKSSVFQACVTVGAILYLRFHFLPGDVKKVVRIAFAPDYSTEIVLPDLSNTDESRAFYLAEKRAFSIKGLYGVSSYQIKTEHDNSYYKLKAIHSTNRDYDIVNTASVYNRAQVITDDYTNCEIAEDNIDFILLYNNHKSNLNLLKAGVKTVYKDFPTKIYIKPDDDYNNPAVELNLILGSDTFYNEFVTTASVTCDFIGNYSYFSSIYRLIKDGTLTDSITVGSIVTRNESFFCGKVIDELYENPEIDLSGVSRTSEQSTMLEDTNFRNPYFDSNGTRLRIGFCRRTYNINNFNSNISTSVKYYFPNIGKTITFNISSKALLSGNIGNNIVLDDFSLINTAFFNSSHRQPVYNNVTSSTINILLDTKADRDLIRWKSKADYTISQSVKISKNTDSASGAFSFSFVDGTVSSSPFRSRGKHRLYCEFNNKRTGQTVVCGDSSIADDYPLGSFEVYQNLFVGLSAQMSQVYSINPSTTIDFKIFPALVGNLSKVLDSAVNVDMIYYMEPLNTSNYYIMGTSANVVTSWTSYFTHLTYRFTSNSNNGVVQNGGIALSARVVSNNSTSYPAPMLAQSIFVGDGYQYSIFFSRGGVKDSDATVGYYKFHRLYDGDYSTQNWVDQM